MFSSSKMARQALMLAVTKGACHRHQMIKTIHSIRSNALLQLGFSCLCLAIAVLPRSGSAESSHFCRKSQSFFAQPDSPDFRKYAPDRILRVQHLALDVTPDFQKRTVKGTARLKLKTTGFKTREVKLDAVKLSVSGLSTSKKLRAWHATDSHIVITLEEELPPGSELDIEVVYSAEPTRGLYFRTPEMGYKAGDTHLFTQGESIEARHWYPCLDSPNQIFTSEITCHVPEGMLVVSNGRLVSTNRDPVTTLTSFHWHQEKPHANYLLTLVAGFLHKIEDSYRGIPLAFYTPASEAAQAPYSFRNTREMMAFFEEEIGVPYPWAQYAQVCVNDFVAGGMENTSATTLTDHTLFSPATENLRDSEGLVAHELAHQWFGDLVTCKDWSHLWLNEGFATYYETLATGHLRGKDAMLFEMHERAKALVSRGEPPTPIVRRTYDNPDSMFNHLAYEKGSWVLHMLRSELGVNHFRKAVKTFLERHQHENVVTEDFRRVLEEVTGRTMDRFFDQWVYLGHYPELDVQYRWDENEKAAYLRVTQTQTASEKVAVFQFPLPVRMKGSFGSVDQVIQITEKATDFRIPLASAPQVVRIDPECTVLARIQFSPSREMLLKQLEDQEDMIGRLMAVERLGEEKALTVLPRMMEVAKKDSFYGVRLAAINALSKTRSEEAFACVASLAEDKDARIRLRACQEVINRYGRESLDFAKKALRREKNPAIIAVLLRGIGGYEDSWSKATLIEFLNSTSYRNEMADASIQGIRLQRDPELASVLIETLARRGQEFTPGGWMNGMSTVAILASELDQKDSARMFLLNQLSNPREGVRVSAISALGTLGDPKSVGALEKVSFSGKSAAEREEARRAISVIQSNRRAPLELQDLRQEVLKLQGENQEMRGQIEELRKSIQAQKPTVKKKKSDRR